MPRRVPSPRRGGSRQPKGVSWFLPGRMTGLPPEFYTLKTLQWLALNAPPGIEAQS